MQDSRFVRPMVRSVGDVWRWRGFGCPAFFVAAVQRMEAGNHIRHGVMGVTLDDRGGVGGHKGRVDSVSPFRDGI